jgi:16S rRNA (guanine527-N7)-methyltransferase
VNRELEALAEGLNLELTPAMKDQFDALTAWLDVEAISAGGLGPREGERLESRHLADSLAYAGGWEEAPADCADLGSGVGLPGLVLAIVWPGTAMTLIDRSAKRSDLVRRASRVARIPVSVVEADVFSIRGPFSAVVSRAAVPAAKLRPVLTRLLTTGGRAVVSGDGSPVAGFQALQVLDRPTRLLMMQKS